MDQHLRAILLSQRGDNRPLAAEIIEKLSPESKERLFRVLQGLKQDAEQERGKRRRGQFF